MSHRSLGVLFLKLIGIFYVLYAVQDLVELRTALLWENSSRVNIPVQEAVTTLFADVVVAVVSLTQTERIAGWLFSEREESIPARLSPYHLLFLGMALIGVWILAYDLGWVLANVADFIWWSGADRRLLYGSERVEAVMSGLKSLLFVGIGFFLYRYATSKLSMLES